MDENIKQMTVYAPYLPEDSEEEIMVEMGMKCSSRDVEYDICNDLNLTEESSESAVSAEKDVLDGMDDYYDEEEFAVLPTDEADDYEFMPDVNYDIYNQN